MPWYGWLLIGWFVASGVFGWLMSRWFRFLNSRNPIDN